MREEHLLTTEIELLTDAVAAGGDIPALLGDLVTSTLSMLSHDRPRLIARPSKRWFAYDWRGGVSSLRTMSEMVANCFEKCSQNRSGSVLRASRIASRGRSG